MPLKEDSFRAYLITVDTRAFVAAAACHRSESPDPVDHYRVAYSLLSMSTQWMDELEVLKKEVENNEEISAGFIMDLTKRGVQSTARLGKLILSHLLMDLFTARVMFDLGVYNELVEVEDLAVKVEPLVVDEEGITLH